MQKVLHLYEVQDEISSDEVILKDGRSFDRYSAPMLGASGKYYGRVWYFRDITGRKQAEKVRERLVAELESKNTEMERFIYTVSHDLRSPLVTINGFVGFLQSDLAKGSSGRVKEDLKMISSAISRMERLLKDTLELSRIGRVANPPDEVPFTEIVQESLDQISEKILVRGVQVAIQPDLPSVNVDRMRIVEVLTNLMENSIKYIGDQPHPIIEVGCRLDGEETVFFVKDNGIGIDPSQHDKVFGLFYKVDKKSEGSGAGLAIIKRIIEVHAGRIWIESKLGEGCTVCFTLAEPK
jgi:light-regulated signal transduction histidine kinase (bacteriophytochrome)